MNRNYAGALEVEMQNKKELTCRSEPLATQER